MSNLNTSVLRRYANYVERRFDRLEVKELRAPDPRRAEQMDKYLTELEAVHALIDQIESEN